MTIVTLIHGTWARRAGWTKDNSPLAKALKEHVHDNEVRIESFNWSGLNLHFMRRRAAAELRNQILSLAKQFPDAKQFLIGHSHGGNVALYSDVGDCVTGIICLSTPFIQCRRRQFFPKETLSLLRGFCVVAILLTSLFEGLRYYGAGLRSEPYSMGPVLPTLLAISALVVVIVLGLKWLAYSVLGHTGNFRKIFEDIFKSFVPLPQSSKRLLILRAPGDEASAALGASMFATWVSRKLWSPAQVVHRFGRWLQTKDEGYPSIGIFDDILGSLVKILYVLLAFPLLLMCTVFSIPFGIDAALVAFLFEFSAETTPVGAFSVISLHAPTAKGLWHSLPYQDPEAFNGIVGWINHRVRELQETVRSRVAMAIRSYASSRSYVDWREVEQYLDKIDRLNESNRKYINSVGPSRSLRTSPKIDHIITVSEKRAKLSLQLRAIPSPPADSQIQDLQMIADKFEHLDEEFGPLERLDLWEYRVTCILENEAKAAKRGGWSMEARKYECPGCQKTIILTTDEYERGLGYSVRPRDTYRCPYCDKP